MSTFTNDTGSVTIDFSIQFDLTSTPKLKVTDNSTYSAAQTGVNVFIKVTRPDGIVRNFDSTSPDITGDSGSLPIFEYDLPLSPSDGQVSKGQYKVEYNFTVGSDATVKKTKTINYDFSKISLTTFQDINEFTPLVKVKDTTPNYTVTNYNLDSISRVFSASNNVNGSDINNQTTTGTTTSDREFSLIDTQSKFYDTQYTVNLAVTLTYTHYIFLVYCKIKKHKTRCCKSI